MERKHGKQAQPSKAGTSVRAKPASPPKPPARHPHKDSIWRDVLGTIVIVSILLLIEVGIERTTFGEQLKQMGYNVLQNRLSADRVPVTIVDTSDLDSERFDIDGRTGTATPRESLRRMIDAIVSQHPVAIGLDIDFSPDQNGFIHPRDPEFFDYCLQLREHASVDVFLGVARGLVQPRAKWLGAERYAPLAANILIPNDSSRMVGRIDVSEVSIPSLSVALADAYHHRALKSGRSWLRASIIQWLAAIHVVEARAERGLAEGLVVEDFLVDFSPLDSIEPLKTLNPVVLADPSQRSRFEGKVILLGDATLSKAADTFVVPGRPQPYPGVFLHASAVYTAINAPLYEISGLGRVLIDLLFTTMVAVPVFLIRARYGAEHSEVPHRLQRWLTFGVVLGAVLIGVWGVRLTRIMWDDFMLALAAIVFHPAIERGYGDVRALFRRRPQAAEGAGS